MWRSEIMRPPPESRIHWKNLERDQRGRWIKQELLSTQMPKQTSMVSSPPANTVIAILDKIERDFHESCPRCSGDMGLHTIRCGPQRLVKVKKCGICNFWLPLANQSS